MITRILTLLVLAASFVTPVFAGEDFACLFADVKQSYYCETEISPSENSESIIRISDGTTTNDFALSANGGVLAFRRYRNRCDFFLDGAPALSLADTWQSEVSVLASGLSAGEGADEYRQELGHFSFSDSFMVAAGDTNALRDWEKISGEWSLHSVTGRTIRATDAQKLTRFPEPANSPNFYSLSGSGRCALIAAGELFYSHYAVRASIQHSGGTNGIAFLITDAPSFWLFAAETDQADGKLIFSLRESCIPEESAGNVVRAVKTELFQGQWYMLEVRSSGDEIVCSVDGIEVIRHRAKLTPGGMFGLFTDTPETSPARFDDFSAETFADLDTESEEEAALAELHGNFGETRLFGCTDDPPAEISIPLTLKKPGDAVTISIGARRRDAFAPAFTATAELNGESVEFSLWKADSSDGELRQADSFSIPVTDKRLRDAAFSLDGRDGRFAVARLGGTTIMLASSERPPAGAAGLKSTGTAMAGRIPKIRRTPSKYTDQFEKNKLYITDPFMRHWASTAGQWLTYTNDTARYKDDILNHVTLEMPVIDNTEMHLAVPDGSEEGDLRITTGTGSLEIGKRGDDGNYSTLFTWNYPSAVSDPGSGAVSTNTPVVFRLDGFRFAFLSNTGELFRCEIDFPHRGRGIFFKKVPQIYMGNIIVTRSPVIDCLFSESLHDWSVNGGVWEVVNRFQCLPKWSHMDGENAESIAALWSKYLFSGDFSMTFIAGMRHGWYNRMGDMNLTLMNNANTPSDGYTLSVTGWDPDESQRWSKLYRNGAEIASTTKYTVPRRRLGNVRKVYEPLLASGRDVHGAWYSIRLRRNGKKLSFLFDNETVFETEDEAPLASGSFGIWTYLNSMVVARVRLAAESIRPRPFAFTELETMQDDASAAKATVSAKSEESAEAAASERPLFFNGLPVSFIRPEYWYSADDVNLPQISFSREDGEDVMTVTSTLGSGSFLAAPTGAVTSVSGALLAGWTFEVARSKKALFNFEYSYSRGEKTSPFSYVISGYSGEKGKRAISGASPLPPHTPGGRKKVWTPVTVWLPACGYAPSDYVAAIQGFGNLEHSDVQKGLHGNGPGEWFAIRRMRPIYRDTPSPDNSNENRGAFAEEISAAFAAGRGGIVNKFEVPAAVAPSRPVIQWILPPSEAPGLIASFSEMPDYLIKVKSTLPWPNPMIAVSNVTVNGIDSPHSRIENNELTIPLPRPFCPTSAPAVKVSFQTTSGRPFTQMLLPGSFANGDTPRPPVITSVKFPGCRNAAYESFESQTNAMSAFLIDSQKPELTPDIIFGDPVQGAFMRVSNKGYQRRNLSAIVAKQFDLAKSPRLQFRYRGDDMARVNLGTGYGRNYSFSHLEPTADSLGNSKLDGSWHTAICRVSESGYKNALSFFTYPSTPNIRIASNRIDGRNENQTGLYSYFDIDEIAWGPALRKETLPTFGFVAEFDAPSGLTSAQYAVIPGLTPFDSLTDNELAGVVWHDFDPSATEMTVPVLDGLKDGVYHLVIRAFTGETATPRPADIPFEIDNEPPSVSVTRGTFPEDKSITSLNITVDAKGGTPPDLTSATLSDGKRRLSYYSPRHAGASVEAYDKMQLSLNWPLILRDQIQASTNGASVMLVISNIADGAGNVLPPVTESFKIDFESDKQPPYIALNYPGFILTAMEANSGLFNGYGEHIEQKPVKDATAPGTYLSMKVKNVASAQARHKASATINLKRQVMGRQVRDWFSTTNRWLMLRARIGGNIPPPEEEAFSIKFIVEKTPPNSTSPKKGNAYTVPVPMTNQAPAYIYGDLAFETNKWFDIAFDVDAALKSVIGTDSEVKIQEFSILLPPRPGFTLDIASVCIMPDWKEGSAFDLHAFDPSGLEGVFVDGKFSNSGWFLNPAKTSELLPDKTRFFRNVSVHDRAGNASKEVQFPFPPR